MNDDGTYDLLARKSLSINIDDTSDVFFPNPLSFISSAELDKYDTRAAYDFYGWSTEPLSPSAVESFNDSTWFTEDKGHLIVTTNSANSAALTPEQQYDNWSSQRHVPGQQDYTFYAVYGVHKYAMTYYDGNGTVLDITYVPAGQFIVSAPPTKMPYKDDTNIAFDRVYKFVG